MTVRLQITNYIDRKWRNLTEPIFNKQNVWYGGLFGDPEKVIPKLSYFSAGISWCHSMPLDATRCADITGLCPNHTRWLVQLNTLCAFEIAGIFLFESRRLITFEVLGKPLKYLNAIKAVTGQTLLKLWNYRKAIFGFCYSCLTSQGRIWFDFGLSGR